MPASLAQLRAALPQGFNLYHVEVTGSTNDDAADWANSDHLPQALFVADRQQSGRGRRGRGWDSPAGNLYASLLLPKPENILSLGHYGFMISLAIHDALKAVKPDIPVTLKWPNDVLIEGRKCGGVLIEVAGAGLIIGFGINFAHAPSGTPYPITKLDAWIGPCQPLDFCARIIQHFFRLHILPAEELLSRWQAAAQGVGGEITINLPHETLRGIFVGIAGDGALLLEAANETKKIYAGDVFLGA